MNRENKAIPVAKFQCADPWLFPPHYLYSESLYWWEGEGKDKPGWYCAHCALGKPGFTKNWSLMDEIEERPQLTRFLLDVELAKHRK